MSIIERINQTSQRGSSLIEVMVSLMILAVGLLGVLAMQNNSLRSNQRGYLGTEAQILASDMANRILASDDIDDPNDDKAYDGIDSAGGYSDPGCIAIGCTGGQLIAYDAFNWSDELRTRLPGGIGTVTFDAAGVPAGVSGIYTITVMWDNELTTGVTGTGCSGDSRVDLTCYQLEVMM